jgi:hypothetical protein
MSPPIEALVSTTIASSFVSVPNSLERFDYGLVFENGVKFIKSARRIGQVLFEAFSEYQLSIADCLSENKDDAVARRIV